MMERNKIRKSINIHYLQHVPFEGPASIKQWADDNGHPITGTHVYKNHSFPELTEFDWLVIMGGPMGTCDEDEYLWLKGEKKFIRQSIAAGKTVIGICLGAQLIADVLGADVYPNKQKEIGWFPVEFTPQGFASKLFKDIPRKFYAFHWHGDTFSLPDGAEHLVKSNGCENQAFIYNDRILGLQFHLESTKRSVADLVKNCENDIIPNKYIQNRETILSIPDHDYHQLNHIMFSLLNRLPAAID
jgi:GMP synthase (glutamine-hydrolysing)